MHQHKPHIPSQRRDRFQPNACTLSNVQTVQAGKTHLWRVDVECGVRRHNCSAPQEQQHSFAARSPHQGARRCPTQQQRRQQCPAACPLKHQCTVLLSTQQESSRGSCLPALPCQDTMSCEGKGQCRCCLQVVHHALIGTTL